MPLKSPHLQPVQPPESLCPDMCPALCLFSLPSSRSWAQPCQVLLGSLSFSICKMGVVTAHRVRGSAQGLAQSKPLLCFTWPSRAVTRAQQLLLCMSQVTWAEWGGDVSQISSRVEGRFLGSCSDLYLPHVPAGGRVLQIPLVRAEDAGRYSCRASNEVGEDWLHYELLVLSEWPGLGVGGAALRSKAP